MVLFDPHWTLRSSHWPGHRIGEYEPQVYILDVLQYVKRLSAYSWAALTRFCIAMCKSSALGFVLLFAFLFRLEQPSWKLVFIIVTMTIGVVMMVAGETAF